MGNVDASATTATSGILQINHPVVLSSPPPSHANKSPMSLHQRKAVSAPGKVLVAGGYLVLDRDYTGLVFGLNARIHVVIEPIQTRSGVTLGEIVVRSPQFKAATWGYGYRLAERGGGIALTQLAA